MEKDNVIAIEFIVVTIVNAMSLMVVSYLFNGIYISSFLYAIITSLVIFILNETVKPFIKTLMMPINLLTLGLFYPFVNVFVLKIASFFLGNNFRIPGLIRPFFISIVLTFISLILNDVITNKVMRKFK